MNRNLAAAASIAALTISHASKMAAQQAAPRVVAEACLSGSPVTGVVRDTTGAAVASAAVSVDGGEAVQTAADGRFRLACVTPGDHKLHVAAESFAAEDMPLTARNRGDVAVVLKPASVSQDVNVSADEEAHGVDNNETGASRTLKGDDLKALAEDPDDLLRELQQLTAGSGGNPSNAVITVDGFQNNATLPPKSSIAYIRVNPDLFAAEYGEPPYTGGRVEVYTKPGQSRYHGAVSGIFGGSALNARDPFAVSKGSIGKERFGGEFSGPIRKTGSDFALSLQYRHIDDVAVVNAIQLDSAGNQQVVNSTVPRPQNRWDASARTGWQLGAKNTFIANYTVFNNQLSNMGVGGSTLQEAGYDLSHYEHVLRLTNVTTASANLMHEGRISFRWADDLQTPHSTSPGLQVAGAFTGGGSELGRQNEHEFGIEILDDAIITHGNHSIKIGMNGRIYREREQMTKDFNGMYNFGGGVAPVLDASGHPIPGQTTTISGLEQYRRAQLGLAGGAATAYTVVTGTPQITFTQTRWALFGQDEWKVTPNVKISYGLRYFIQNEPLTLLSIAPRLGFAWSPDKKQNWTIKLHSGLFNGRYSTEDATEFRRLDGQARMMDTIYSPVYGDPFQNAAPIGTVRTKAPNFSSITYNEEQVEVDRSLAGGWNVQGTVYWIRVWNDARTRNINSPVNGSPTGPRPLQPNLNILQAQNSGSLKGDIEFVSVSQQKSKWLGLFFGYARVDLRDNANDDTFFSPQSSLTDAGEYARRTDQNTHQMFGNGMLHIPGKVELSSEFQMTSGSPYNITTGFDNNGDGNFNDRPTYAKLGDPNAITTRYGLLVANGGTGVFPRSAGTMPWTFHIDANLQRAFMLTPHAAADHAQTLTVNLRSSNLLNHTNVKQVGSVLGSPLFGRPYQADSGRRLEVGVRYSF